MNAPETPDGVLLKAELAFAPIRPEDVRGMLAYKGKAKTLEEMEAAIVAAFRELRAPPSGPVH